ncbi:DUF3592 domain-containing protein [Limibacter armeniacum]|uniref:DUF3592 domain-containing protein n=1 Tax=Limibacter armeniacum TaxID=466084 RepID=UPI002FE62CAB
MTSLFINLLLFAIMVFGVIMLANGISGILKGLASSKWATTEGIVTKVSQEKSLKATNAKIELAPGGKVKISYKYKTGHKFEHGNFVLDLGTAESVNRGDIIDIYYNPEDPKQSVMEKGIQGKSVQQLVIGGLVVVFVSYMIFF